MTTVELHFPFTGKTLPSDQGYALYSAISHLIPEVHEADWFALETIPGIARGDGTTHLDQKASLKLRIPQDRIPVVLKLAGKRLVLGSHAIRLGAPTIFPLKPSPQLYARIVTIKGFTEPEPFLEAVHRKLAESGIHGEVAIGPRRVLQVSDHKVVGFSLAVHELSDEASIQLQAQGLGGRRKMGCGYFSRIRLDRVIGEIPKRMRNALNCE